MKSYYKILRKIGEGGFARVHLAKNLKNNSLCAIKEFNITSNDPREKEKLIQQVRYEASLLLKLSHPKLPRIVDYFQVKDKHYIAMDYIEGKDLKVIISNIDGFLPEIQVIEWGLDICSVLEYFHNLKPQPLIIRDLKPQNVMLSTTGEIKLIDFGISKPVDSVTRTAAKAFSPGFSPPEQYSLKGGTDIRSDIYSLGATLYYLAAKVPPEDALERVMEGKSIEPASKFRDKPLPNEFDNILLKALEIKKENRFQNVSEIRSELQKLKLRCKNDNIKKYDIFQFFPELATQKKKEAYYKEKKERELRKLREAIESKYSSPMDGYKPDLKEDNGYFSDTGNSDEIEVVKVKTGASGISSKIDIKTLLMVAVPVAIIILFGAYWVFFSSTSALARAKQFTLEKNYSQAEKEYLKVILKNPRSIEAYEGLIRVYLDTEMFDRASEQVVKLNELEPENLKYNHILADKLFENGEYIEAIKNYKYILNKNSNDYSSYIGLGKVYRAISDYKNSIKWFEKGLKIDLTESQKAAVNEEIGTTCFFEGKNYFEDKLYEEAKKSFESVSDYSSDEKLLAEAGKHLNKIEELNKPAPTPTADTYSPDSYYYEPPPPPPANPPPSNPDIMW